MTLVVFMSMITTEISACYVEVSCPNGGYAWCRAWGANQECTVDNENSSVTCTGGSQTKTFSCPKAI
jgi:hypothetical protein